MKKTLEQRLIEQAEQMEKSAEAIRQIVAKSKDAGIVWPELDDVQIINGEKFKAVDPQIEGRCYGCYFFQYGFNHDCTVHPCMPQDRADGKYVIYKKVE